MKNNKQINQKKHRKSYPKINLYDAITKAQEKARKDLVKKINRKCTSTADLYWSTFYKQWFADIAARVIKKVTMRRLKSEEFGLRCCCCGKIIDVGNVVIRIYYSDSSGSAKYVDAYCGKSEQKHSHLNLTMPC
jgi:hypothetical protein